MCSQHGYWRVKDSGDGDPESVVYVFIGCNGTPGWPGGIFDLDPESGALRCGGKVLTPEKLKQLDPGVDYLAREILPTSVRAVRVLFDEVHVYPLNKPEWVKRHQQATYDVLDDGVTMHRSAMTTKQRSKKRSRGALQAVA
jgi:hypothetical protein